MKEVDVGDKIGIWCLIYIDNYPFEMEKTMFWLRFLAAIWSDTLFCPIEKELRHDVLHLLNLHPKSNPIYEYWQITETG